MGGQGNLRVLLVARQTMAVELSCLRRGWPVKRYRFRAQVEGGQHGRVARQVAAESQYGFWRIEEADLATQQLWLGTAPGEDVLRKTQRRARVLFFRIDGALQVFRRHRQPW